MRHYYHPTTPTTNSPITTPTPSTPVATALPVSASLLRPPGRMMVQEILSPRDCYFCYKCCCCNNTCGSVLDIVAAAVWGHVSECEEANTCGSVLDIVAAAVCEHVSECERGIHTNTTRSEFHLCCGPRHKASLATTPTYVYTQTQHHNNSKSITQLPLKHQHQHYSPP